VTTAGLTFTPEQYGPGGIMLRRFLDFLRHLTREEWLQVDAFDWPSADVDDDRMLVALETLSNQSERWSREVSDDAMDLAPRDLLTADAHVKTAVEAVALRLDRYDDDDFAILYRPFERLVPLECLSVVDCGHRSHPRAAGRAR
jgi:hypothetical protein